MINARIIGALDVTVLLNIRLVLTAIVTLFTA